VAHLGHSPGGVVVRTKPHQTAPSGGLGVVVVRQGKARFFKVGDVVPTCSGYTFTRGVKFGGSRHLGRLWGGRAKPRVNHTLLQSTGHWWRVLAEFGTQTVTFGRFRQWVGRGEGVPLGGSTWVDVVVRLHSVTVGNTLGTWWGGLYTFDSG